MQLFSWFRKKTTKEDDNGEENRAKDTDKAEKSVMIVSCVPIV